MLIPIVAVAVLAVTASLDGYYTYRAQKVGAMETGPARLLYGSHPTRRDLLVKGGAVIAGEIAAVLTAAHFGVWELSLPLFVQSVLHVRGARSGIKISGW